MATWRYIKGSEKDFEGAPEWAMRRVENGAREFFVPEHSHVGKPFYDIKDAREGTIEFSPDYENLIAQRERVTSINDDRLAQDVAAVKTLEMSGYTYHGGELWKPPLGKAPEYITDNVNPKYNRPCKGVIIDVYDVLQAFSVTNPALQHLVKKALAVGQRGHKDKMEDLRDILASAQRAIELEDVKE